MKQFQCLRVFYNRLGYYHICKKQSTYIYNNGNQQLYSPPESCLTICQTLYQHWHRYGIPVIIPVFRIHH
jgi:hypothetical protein